MELQNRGKRGTLIMDKNDVKKQLDDLVGKLRQWLTPRRVEIIATGAAVVLAVAAFVLLLPRSASLPENPTAPPQINPGVTDPTAASDERLTPTGSDIWADALPEETVTAMLWELVTPDATVADSALQAKNTEVKRLGSQNPCYKVTIKHHVYDYIFTVNALTGKLTAIKTIQYGTETDDYLAPAVLVEILRLAFGFTDTDIQPFFFLSGETPYYRIRYTDPSTQTAAAADIHATTGEIMQYLKMLNSETAISFLLEQLELEIDASSCYAWLCTSEEYTYYTISLTEPNLASIYYYVDALTGEQLELIDMQQVSKFTALFSDPNSWYNRALTSLYDSPEDLSLYLLFRYGFDDESRVPTAVELEKLKRYISANSGISRLPVDKMNRTLEQYWGISLDAFPEDELSNFAYLPDTNCYYCEIGGEMEYVEGFVATEVKELEDGTVEVYYTTAADDTIYKVCLMAKGDEYQILSNTSYFISQETMLKRVLNTYSNGYSVANLTCEYDDSNENDLRYHISFTYKGYAYTISMNATTGERAYISRTPANPQDLIVPDEHDIEIVGTTEDGIPIIDNISINDSSGGFFWDHDGSTVIGVHTGEPEFLAIHEESITLTHDGKEHTVIFKWCTNAGELGVYRVDYGSSPDLYVYSISGNDQYVLLDISGDYQSSYSYLLNLSTMEITDPLEKVDVSQLNTHSIRYEFSPDCKAALLHFADDTYYLHIATGELLSLREATGLEDSFGTSFVNNDLLAIHNITMTDEYNGTADCLLYSLTDGSMQTVYTDTPADPLSDYSGMMFFGRLQVHMHNRRLCMIDCLSGSHSEIDLPSCNHIQRFTSDMICIEPFENSNVYLIGPDGSVTHVFTYGQIFSYV